MNYYNSVSQRKRKDGVHTQRVSPVSIRGKEINDLSIEFMDRKRKGEEVRDR